MSTPEMQGERTKRFVLPQIAPSVGAGTYEPCTFDYELPLPEPDKVSLWLWAPPKRGRSTDRSTD